MSKYCPVCESWFSKSINTCPKDNVLLLSKEPKHQFAHRVAIYSAASEIERERIISFLIEDGIHAEAIDEGIAQLPVVTDRHFVIAVGSEQQKSAIKKIENARKDGVIGLSGSFL